MANPLVDDLIHGKNGFSMHGAAAETSYPGLRSGAVAKRSNPASKERVAVWEQEGGEELLHVQSREGRPRGDTPHPR